jgi:biotin-(acetyl-CoA carboxylase) ligase
LLKEILAGVLNWRPRLGTEAFLNTWEASLAFRGQQVQVEGGNGEQAIGELLGLNPDGSLRLRAEHGNSITVQVGEVHLRPVA